MRGFIYAVAGLAVMSLAYWAYSENYKTQAKLREAAQLQRAIGEARETLGMLDAEWAYLNRPERLRDLAMARFDDLQLLPIAPEQFASVAQVAYPKADPVIDDLIASIVSGELTAGEVGADQ